MNLLASAAAQALPGHLDNQLLCVQDIPDYDSDDEATSALQPVSGVPAQHAPAADEGSDGDDEAEEGGRDSVSIMMRAFFASVGEEVREQCRGWQPERAPADKGTPAHARAGQRKGRIIKTPGRTRGGPGRWYTTEVGPRGLGCDVEEQAPPDCAHHTSTCTCRHGACAACTCRHDDAYLPPCAGRPDKPHSATLCDGSVVNGVQAEAACRPWSACPRLKPGYAPAPSW